MDKFSCPKEFKSIYFLKCMGRTSYLALKNILHSFGNPSGIKWFIGPPIKCFMKPCCSVISFHFIWMFQTFDSLLEILISLIIT